MSNYKLNDGDTITAKTNKEFVQKLNESSLFGRRRSLDEFIKETAERCKVQTGSKVRTTNIDIFVKDLVKAGFVTIQASL